MIGANRYPAPAHKRRRSVARLLAVGCTALFIGGLGVTLGDVWGAFASTGSSPANSFAAATDFVAPSASASVVGKTAGGTPGFIKQGGTYFVYANVSDTGNPASGVSTVRSNTSAITTSATATSLASGSFTIGGVTYNRRTASVTANASLAAGPYTYSLTSTDVAANSRTQSGFTVTVDNTVPTGTDVQTANVGSIAGQPQLNDTVTFSFTEPVEPATILAAWTGTATNVTVRINNNAVATGGNDQLLVFNSANSAQLPLGSVNLGRTDYVTANLTFGASGTRSQMTMSGNSVTVALGTASAAGTTAAATGTLTWTPQATPTDRAGNALSTAAVTESGAADKEF